MLKHLIVAAGAALLLAGTASAADLTGAGATFPAPVYAKWAEAYKAQTGTGLNYQAIGSGGGIKQIRAKTVDFGASDKPLKQEVLNEAGLAQFPTVIGGVVPVVNLPGIAGGQIRLTGSLLADIYLGEVKRWTDPRIAGMNPGVKLPNLPITVVHRSDGSGTSFIFTTFLTQLSPAWAGKVGANDAVEWPTGQGGKGNDGVSAFVKQTAGSIGYVEYAYALQNHLTYTKLQNRTGAFVDPTQATFASAASKADWAHAPGYYLILTNQAGPNTWPIVGATFILLYKQQADAAKGAAVLKFFDWGYKNGGPAAEKLDYITLPEPVKALIRKGWAEQIKGANGQPVYVSH